MKKLLSMIGAMTLIGSASTNVIACGKGDEPTPTPIPPAPDTRTDISTKVPNDINLGQLSANTVKTFLANLQLKLAVIANLNAITISDYDIYKAGTTIFIQDSDVVANTCLNIKITAKGSNFKGEKDNITVSYEKDTRIDLSAIITTTSLGKIIISGSIPTKQELLTVIHEKNPSAKDLTIELFTIKGTASATSATIVGTETYKGEITLTYEKDTRIDLNIKTLKTNLKFTKTMNGEEAYNEVRSKIKDLSNNIYNSTDEIKNENTLLISIWENSNQQLADNITSNLNTINSVDIKIKVTDNNKAFKEFDWKILDNIEVNKTNLNIITKLTGLNITADSSKSNFELWKEVILANEFKDKQDIFASGWNIDFFNNLDKNINLEMQKHGDLYCIIYVNDKNIKWTGQTLKLKIILN